MKTIGAVMMLLAAVCMAALGGCSLGPDRSKGPGAHGRELTQLSVAGFPIADGAPAEAKKRAAAWHVEGAPIEVPTPLRDSGKPDMIETPYTAEQIRMACTPGLVLSVAIDEKGKPAGLSVTTFFDSGVNDTGIRFQQHREGGPSSVVREARSTWEGLRSHALFPASETKLSWVMTKGPMGERGCWVYRRTFSPGGTEGKAGSGDTARSADSSDKSKSPEQTMVFFFAEGVAGPPIRWEVWTDGEMVAAHTIVAREVMGEPEE